jgi:hypothetical protein
VGVLDPVGAVFPGVHHDDPSPETGEPCRRRQPRGPAADDDRVEFALDGQRVHGTGSR